MGNRRHRQERSGHTAGGIVALLVLVCAVCLVCLNQKREIAQIDAKITTCRKALENLKPQLSNCRTQLAALKGKEVVEYAVAHGMSYPNVGQICEMSPRLRNPNMMLAGKGASGASSNVSMATITSQPQNRR